MMKISVPFLKSILLLLGIAFLLAPTAQALLQKSATEIQTPVQSKPTTPQVMVLLDACRNDPGGRADAPNPLTAAYMRGFSFDIANREVQAFATIYATAVGQRAYEYPEKRQVISPGPSLKD
jgi:hypothetical protein